MINITRSVRSLMMLLTLMLLTQVGWAQPWTYDFGTGTGTANNSNSGSGNTTFFSSTPSGGGTYRVRIGTGGGNLILANPGTSLGSGSEAQLTSATSTSTNKFGVYDWTSTSTTSYLKAKVRTTSSGSGNLVIAAGINTIASDGQGFTSHYNNSLAQVRLTYTSGTLAVTRRSGSDIAISGSGFSKDADQIIEVYANNSSATASYVRSGTSYSLSTKTWDLWVDGTRTVTGAATAGTLAAGTALSGFCFFAESSTSNAAIMYVDDIEYSNSLPSPRISSSGTLSAVNTTYGSASATPSSFSLSGVNMTAGITVTPPAGFEVSTVSDFSSNVGDNSSALTVGSSGTIASTTVYVRLKSSATVVGSPYSGNIVLSSTGATSVNVATASSTVSKKALSATGLTGDNKTYNGTTSATATGTASLSGIVSGDESNVAIGGTPVFTFASANVGAAISISTTGYSISGSASGNYSLTQPTLSADITTKSLTVTANDVSKTAGVALSGGSSTAFTSSGLENSETIGSVNIAYGPAGAATGDGATPGVYPNQVTPSAATGGTFLASNYSISYVAGSITVNAAPSTPTITATGTLSAVSTTYGTASSPASFTVEGVSLTEGILITPPTGFEISQTVGGGSGYAATQTLTPSSGTVSSTTVYIRLKSDAAVSGSYNSQNVALTSSGAATVNVPTASSGNTVAEKALTITGLTGTNKEYDRTTTATFSGTATYSGLVNSESFIVSGTPTSSFATASVGTGKTITVTGYTAPSTNYSLTQPTLTADITTKALTISSPAASNKTYDGNTNATVTGILSGVISGDVVTLSGTGTFASANVGDGISVTSTSTLSGADAGNYTLTQPAGLSANITKANQTIIFNALPAKTTADADFAPGATSATSGVNAITYASSNTAVATIVSGNIHIVGAGTSVITASQAGSSNYNAAADVNQTLTVTPAVVTVAAWNFTGISSTATATATTFNSNLVSTSGASDITRGAGAALSSGSNSFRTVGFQNNGISTSNTDYFQVTIGAKTGYKISLRTIDAKFIGTSSFYTSPGVTSQFAYSLDGTNFTLIGSPVQTTSLTMSQIDLSGVSALQNVVSGTTITLRYYASGQTTTGGWGFNSPTSSDNGLAFGGFVEALPAAPTLTAASSATVDADFNITFSDDATWRAAVTSVKYGSNTLSASTDYTLFAGVLTLKPSGSAGSGLRTAGTQTVTVVATNYTDATVSQAIGAGAATKLAIQTQPTAPLNNGEVLATQPVVKVVDQYDNTTSSTATVAATVGNGAWTLGGTSSLSAVSGTATFTNLTATSAAAVTDATISFSSTGLTGVTSNSFNVPAPPRAEPSEHPTSFVAVTGTPGYNTINLSWVDAGGAITPDGYLIMGSTTSFAAITDPSDGAAVADGGLNKNISQGVQAFTFTGLSSNTTYYFKIYSYTNAGSQINYKTDGVIQQSSSTTDRSTSSTDYFRTKTSGNWSTAGTWESSSDGSSFWITATAAPTSAATSITVQNGHTITIGSAVTIDKTTVANGGVLKLVNDGAVSQSGAITLANGATDQLTIQSGGTLQVVVSNSSATYNYAALINYQTSGNINVNSGGKISIGDGTALHIGSGYSEFGYGASTKVTWNDGAIFDINSTGDFILSTSNRTFFPSVSSGISPIFRISAISGNPGGSSPTIINGIFEPNVNITWTGTGVKTFRNGISGSGNLTQGTACGQFVLSGTAQLGGSGILTLDANDLSITGTTTLTTNKQIDMALGTSASIVTVSGTLDLAGYVLSGSTAVTLTGTLKTSHADGIVGNLTNGGTNTLTGGTVDHTSASAQTIAAGTYGSVTNTANGIRTLANGIIKIGGTFTPGSGNYTIGTSTIEFNGSSAQTIPVIPVASGSNYYNLVHSGTSSATLAGSISVANDVTISGTNANSNVYLTDATARTLTINGNLILTDGTLDFAATGATEAGIVELKGNLTQTAGITYTTEALANGQIRFSGSGTRSTPQTITLTSNNTFQYTNLSVNSGTAVQVNSSFVLSGSSNANYTGTLTVNGILNLQGRSVTSDGASGTNNATFILNSGSTLITSSTTGLLGAVPSSFMTRTFNSGANYEFSGSVAITNSNFSNTTMNNVTISNTAGVTLGSNATVNGVLDLSGGKLAIGAYTLNLGGSVSSMSATNCLTGSASSNLTVTGTGALGTLYFDQTTPGITDNIATFALNRTSAGTATLGSNVLVGTSLTLTSGKLSIGSNTLSLAGTVSSMSADNCLTGSAGSNLTITGTGALGALYFDQTAPGTTDNIATFTLNRTSSGNATLGSNASVGTSLTLTNGTLADGGYTLTNAGNIAGTGTHSGSGKIVMTGSDKTISGVALGNLEINSAGNVTLSANASVTGLTLTGGTLADGGFTLTNSGNISGMATHSGAGKITMSGSGKTISGATLGNLELNNAGGFSLTGSPSISQLTFVAGKLTLGNYNVTVSGSISGQSANGYVVTNGTGSLKRSVAASGSYAFPVGTNNYAPVTFTINSVGTPGTISARTTTSDHPQGANSFPLDYTRKLNRYWTIENDGVDVSTSNRAQVDFNWVASELGSTVYGFNIPALKVAKYSGSSWSIASTSNPTSTSITASNISSFSDFVIALPTGAAVLPVSLTSFSGYKDGFRNQLRWVTSSEVNNSGFEVQRSADGVNYQSIGFVNSLAIGGNSQTQLKYNFTDANPNGLKQYYRLKQFDIDGRSSLSNILLIQGEKPAAFEIASVYPNPSRGQVTVLLNAPENKVVTIRLIDLAGRVLQTRQVNVLAGNNSIPFDISNLAKGQYLISVDGKSVKVVRE
jgi:hypothetical protein